MRPNEILNSRWGDIISQDDEITWGEPVINVNKKRQFFKKKLSCLWQDTDCVVYKIEVVCHNFVLTTS